VRQEIPSWTLAKLATGSLLVSALAAPLAAAVLIRATEPLGVARTARAVVDGVDLVVRSRALPDAAFLGSKPGDVLQGAAAVTQSPYREFSIRAYPFGSSAPMEGIGIVQPGHLGAYRATGAGRLLRSSGVPAQIFGQLVEGSVRVVDIGLGTRHQATEVVSWLTDASGRLWIIRAAAPLSPYLAAEAGLTAGTSVSASNLSAPAVVPRSELAGATAAHPVVEPASSAANPPRVRFPPWWSGNCDVNNNSESFPLSSWDGLTACGPGPNRGGADVAVDFYPGAWGELEWECVELSMRWLYLEYGVRPYPANGSQVVANYSSADGGHLRQIANDGSSVPQPGDVLSMEPTSAEGHTAVVTGTNVTHGKGTISILEQNMNGGNGTNTLNVVGNVVQPDYGMPVTEWLQGPAPAAPGVPVGDLVRDGGFEIGDPGGWRTEPGSHFAVLRAGELATRPYAGNGFGAVSATAAGGGIYQDISFPVTAGDSFCADAEVVSAGKRPEAQGTMTVWLLGDSARESSSIGFGPLPGDGQWTPRSTCVTAARAHSDIRIQFYDDPDTSVLGIDVVDVHQSLVEDGGFKLGDPGGWRTESDTHFAVARTGELGTRPYAGNGFGAVSTTVSGGGIYQDISLPIRAGDSFCADAEVVSAGKRPKAWGTMTVWLLGDTAPESSSIGFGPLPGKSQWTPKSTCVTATRAHADLRIQFYDDPRTSTLGLDVVDAHQSFVEDGAFNPADPGGWRTESDTHFAVARAGELRTRPYAGGGFGAVSTTAAGGGIYQDISFPVTAGESFCADAEVVSAGTNATATGNMTIWLLGKSASQWSSVPFGPLPGNSQWTHKSTCLTATSPHSDIRIQFYDDPRTLILGIDAVDLR